MNKRIKSLNIDQIGKYLKTKKIIIVIWLITVFFSSLITITEGYKKLSDFYINNFRVKNSEYEKIVKLKPHVHISYIEELIGDPTIIQTSDLELGNDNFDKYPDARKEYVFVHKNYYVQAITNKDEMVVSLAITSRTKDFNPIIYRPGQSGNKKSKIILNKTTFSEFGNDADASCTANIGARRFNYYEEYHGSNPDNYQNIIVAVNDSGYIDSNIIGYDKLFEKIFEEGNDDRACQVAPEFRNNAINTVILFAPFKSLSDVNNYWVGPNYDAVRVID